MKKLWLLLVIVAVLISPTAVRAIECGDEIPANDPAKLGEYISKCQQKIDESKATQSTLKAAINLLNSKINLAQAQIRNTNAQIEQLEKEIEVLSGVVAGLNGELDNLVDVFVSRVRESYKTRDTNLLWMFFASDSFSTFQNRLHYLQTAQRRNQIIMKELEAARIDYDQQKITKEEKQAEVEKLRAQLESQKKVLGTQQTQKNQLLAETKNNEKRYQQLLSQARAELEAIENIIAGKGSEQEVRDVSSGELIARVIQGASCNSSGEHVHFIVAQNTVTKNPFGYLKSADYENCSGSSCGSSDGDQFNPSGSWDWPISPRIRFSQGYGETWAVRNTWVGSVYKFHNGIDINSDSDEVKAVSSGKLFRGSYTGTNGCALKYVRVDHKDSDLDTYYLHVNYF